MSNFIDALRRYTTTLNGGGYLCHMLTEEHRERLNALLFDVFGASDNGIMSLAFCYGRSKYPSNWSMNQDAVIHGLRHMIIAEEMAITRQPHPPLTAYIRDDMAALRSFTEHLQGADYLCNVLARHNRADLRSCFEDRMVRRFRCEQGEAIITAAFGQLGRSAVGWKLRRTSIVHGLRHMVLHQPS